jgi:hypothetical protein
MDFVVVVGVDDGRVEAPMVVGMAEATLFGGPTDYEGTARWVAFVERNMLF